MQYNVTIAMKLTELQTTIYHLQSSIIRCSKTATAQLLPW